MAGSYNGIYIQWNTVTPLKIEILQYMTAWMNLDGYANEISQS